MTWTKDRYVINFLLSRYIKGLLKNIKLIKYFYFKKAVFIV